MYRTLRTALPLALLICGLSLWPAYSADVTQVRQVIARVHTDLAQALDDARKGKKGKNDLERLDKANKRLSDLDKKLSRDKYDQGKVEGLLNAIKSVHDHNTLSPQSRDGLQADIDDLRRIQSTRGNL